MDRIRDGRSFTTRRVVAIQHGRAIFNLSASFHVDEPGSPTSSRCPRSRPRGASTPWPTRLEPYRETLGDWFDRPHPIDQRHIGDLPFSHGAGKEPVQRLWIRADGTLPDDPLLHACIAAYASDMSLFDTMLAPHDVQLGRRRLHGGQPRPLHVVPPPFRADEWLLYDMDSPSAYGARGLARGFMFTRDGRAGRLDGPGGPDAADRRPADA